MKLRHPIAFPLLFLPMLGACATGDAQQQQQKLAGIYAPSGSMQATLASNGLYKADFAMGIAGRGVAASTWSTWGTWRALPDGRACFTPASLDNAHPQAYGRNSPRIPAGRIAMHAAPNLREFAQIMRGAAYSTDPAARHPGEDENNGKMKRGPFILALPQVLSPDGSKRQMRIYRFDPKPGFNDYWISLSPVPKDSPDKANAMFLPVLFGKRPGTLAQPAAGSGESCGRIALEKAPEKPGADAQAAQNLAAAIDPPEIEHDGKRYERLALTPLPAVPLPPQEAEIATGINGPAKLHAFAVSALLRHKGSIDGQDINRLDVLVVMDGNGQPMPSVGFVQDMAEKTRSATAAGPVFAHMPMEGKNAPALRISATPMPGGMLKIALWTSGDPLVLGSGQLNVESTAIRQAKARIAYFLKKRR